jgi:protein-tyrosine-phosphatase/predicted ATP-grasp superfamily ATP-dependent carboligase
MRCLILDGHSRAALESAQALGRNHVEVFVAGRDPYCLAFRSRYLVEKFILPDQSDQEFLNWLVEMHRRYRFDLIIPSTDFSLRQLMALGERDELRTRAVISSNQSLETALSKDRTIRIASEMGIAVPASTLYVSAADVFPADQFPTVLKPLRSKVFVDGRPFTLEVTIATDENTRARGLRELLEFGPVLEQRYVRGVGIGLELLFEGGQCQWFFAHERLHELPLTGGASSYRKSIVAPPEILNKSIHMLERLSWHGVAMVEFKLGENGTHYLMEINPRLWGSLALSIDAGVNFPIGLLNLAVERRLPPQPLYRLGYYTRDLVNDVEWVKDNLRADHSDPILLTRPRVQSFAEYLRPLIGRESWDHFDFHDLRVTNASIARIIKRYLNILVNRAKSAVLKLKLSRHHSSVTHSTKERGVYPRKILFVCFGNICRSPFAEGLARQKITHCAVASAGFHNKDGRPVAGHIRVAAVARGLDLSNCFSQHLTPALVSESDLILLMDRENFRMMSERFPSAMSRSTLLGFFAQEPIIDIEDPYFMQPKQVEKVIGTIESGVSGLRRFLSELERP